MTLTEQPPAEAQTTRPRLGTITILAATFGIIGVAYLLSNDGPASGCNLSSESTKTVRLNDRLSTVQEKLGCEGEETSRWGSPGNIAFTQAFRSGGRQVDIIFNHGRAAAINRY